jgi:hypothetical protein
MRDDGVSNVKVKANENSLPVRSPGLPLSVNDPRLTVGPTNESVEAVLSTVTIGFGKLVPLKVKPNSVGLELNGFELKAPNVIP